MFNLPVIEVARLAVMNRGTWICVPVLLTGCVTLDKSLYLSGLPFAMCLKGLVLSGNVDPLSLGMLLGLGRGLGLWGIVFNSSGMPVSTHIEGAQDLGPGEPHCLWPISFPL